MSDNEKYIGIIMKKEQVTEGVHIYFPYHITDGYLIGDDEDDTERLFEDMYSGEQYLQYNDVNGSFSNENVIGYLIKEKDLLKEYEDLSLSEAKQEYFDDSKEFTLIGFYIYSQEKIEFLKLGISDLFYYLNALKLSNQNPFEFISSEKLYELLLNHNEGIGTLSITDELESSTANSNVNDEESMISIPIKDFEEILKMSSNEIKQTLSEMKKSYDKIMSFASSFDENINDNTDYTKEDILKRIDNAYDYILNVKEISKMRGLISGLIDMYTDLVISLDDVIDDEKTHDKATDFFYNTIDLYESLLKMDDINEIKQNIKKIRNKQRNHIGNMIDIDTSDYYKHNQRQKELNETFKDKKEDKKIKFNPKDMKEFFDKKIIGQEEAKIDVISAIFMNSLMDDPINKNSCLLIGPTGSGKTLIAESVSEFLDLPFVSIDTTQLTSPGYVGADIEDFLSRLISVANGDIEKAQQGIVLLDEIDKKGTESNGDVSGRGVLNTLLPFIQGTVYTVPVDSSFGKKKVQFDTKNLTIFATGAFTDVAKEKDKGFGNRKIGFSQTLRTDNKEDIEYKKFTREDLKKYGNMPDELLGRFSTITQLSGHTKESLITILTNSNISNLLKEKEKLKIIDIDLSWTDDYLDKIAEYALTLKTGARSLKSAIEESIKSARWEAINNIDEISGIILNGETVQNADKAVIVYKDGCTNTVEEIKKNKEQNNSKVKEKTNDK